MFDCNLNAPYNRSLLSNLNNTVSRTEMTKFKYNIQIPTYKLQNLVPLANSYDPSSFNKYFNKNIFMPTIV